MAMAAVRISVHPARAVALPRTFRMALTGLFDLSFDVLDNIVRKVDARTCMDALPFVNNALHQTLCAPALSASCLRVRNAACLSCCAQCRCSMSIVLPCQSFVFAGANSGSRSAACGYDYRASRGHSTNGYGSLSKAQVCGE